LPTMSAQLSREQLTELARRGATAEMERLEAEMAAIRRAFPDMVSQAATTSATVTSGRGLGSRLRGTLSEAGRAAIAAAQKARWARVKNGGSVVHEKVSVAKTRKRPAMSAAQRKAVGQRMKKYWAARRRAHASAAKS
jgi:hypothetical protein